MWRRVLPVVLCACAEEGQLLVVEAPMNESSASVEPSATPSSPLDGSYELSGEVREDGCARRIELAAQHVRADVRRGVLHADVVNRDYKLELYGGNVVADGSFVVPGTCPGTRVKEHWTFAATNGGASLAGELESRWTLGPSCQECTVIFEVWAERSE